MTAEPSTGPAGARGGREAGVALVTVLWFVAMTSALAVAMVGYGRETALASRHSVHAIEGRAVLRSAVELAAASLGQGRWPAAGPLAWRHGAFLVQVSALPESAKIDLNAASDDLVEALAAVAAASLGRSGDEALAVAHAILDWRDPAGTRRLAGATADDYASAGRLGRPRHGPFRHVAELRSVLGIDQALFAVIADAVTVHHGLAEPDGQPLPSLVEAALDRARGLGVDAESAFASAEQPLDESGDAGAPPAFVTDPRGLYTLDIDIVHEDGPGFRQAMVIWIDPPHGNRSHVVLATRSGLLPAAAGSLDPVAWPGR
jgi:general secretion pathway protein K